MNSVQDLNKYFNSHQLLMESDSITKDIIKSYFEDIALKEKWGEILHEEFKVGTDGLDLSKKANLESNTDQPPKQKSKNLIYAILFGTITALIIAFTMWPSSPVTPETSEEKLMALLSDHYSNPIPRDLVKGAEEDRANIQNAYALYQAKDYENAIPLLENVVNTDPTNDEHRFYLGLSYLYNKDAEKAVTEFEWILNQENSNYSDAATWHIALAYTEAGNYDTAKKFLNEVSSWTGNEGKLKLAKDAQLILQEIENK